MLRLIITPNYAYNFDPFQKLQLFNYILNKALLKFAWITDPTVVRVTISPFGGLQPLLVRVKAPLSGKTPCPGLQQPSCLGVTSTLGQSKSPLVRVKDKCQV
jgi:hypothetical protein